MASSGRAPGDRRGGTVHLNRNGTSQVHDRFDGRPPGYRFWVVLRDRFPILAFEQNKGMAWTPHYDDGFDLTGLYDLSRHNLVISTPELLRLADNV